MSVWTVLSAGAVLAAGVPSLYFASRLRQSNPAFAILALLLALALFVHGAFHFLEFVEVSRDTTAAMEALSAALTLAFAVVYWLLRKRP